MNASPYIINGSLGSPYSLKMRAIMRYRRIPHVWKQMTAAGREEVFSKVKVPVIPIIEYPDGSFHNDSTPMVIDLEAAHKDRSIVPDDEAQGFLAWLLEDLADEWATKMMFHYRWYRPRDQEQMSRWLIFDNSYTEGPGQKAITDQASFIRDRQVGRMAIVGCTDQNKPLIEDTANEALTLLNTHVTTEPFFFGSRPSVADFAWFGQLSQLATDPTSYDLLREKYLFALRWIQNADDLGGVEGSWRDPEETLSPLVEGLLKMAGEVYLPFLVANAEAHAREDEAFFFIGRGHTYEQATFKYQVKCLQDLKDRYAGLSKTTRERLEPILTKAKCLSILEG